ncbi:MAG: hypothetical protein MHMPM18_003043 [Marteilia pararefringens]
MFPGLISCPRQIPRSAADDITIISNNFPLTTYSPPPPQSQISSKKSVDELQLSPDVRRPPSPNSLDFAFGRNFFI